MRRLLLPLASLLACAGPQKPPPVAAATVEPKVIVPRGFEHVPGEIATAYDLTHGGKPDVWTYTMKDGSGKEILLRKEKDLNGDGRVDTWEKYAPDGSLVAVAYDLDFDGRPDETLFFEKDRLVRKEMAYGFDGIPRTWFFYEEGKLVRKERDTKGDGKIDSVERWDDERQK